MTHYTILTLSVAAGIAGFLLGFISLFVNGYFCGMRHDSSDKPRHDKKSVENEHNKHKQCRKFLLAVFGTLDSADDNVSIIKVRPSIYKTIIRL